jgi:hypothetical protein
MRGMRRRIQSRTHAQESHVLAPVSKCSPNRRQSPEQRPCVGCGSEFSCGPRSPRQFCSRACWWRWRREMTTRQRAALPPKRAYGRPRVDLTCEQCGKRFVVPATEASVINGGRGRRCCSRRCWNERMKVIHSGALSPNWKGGHPYGPTWLAARDAVRQRDQVCRDCGKPPKPRRALDVHHLVPFRSFGYRRHREANAPRKSDCALRRLPYQAGVGDQPQRKATIRAATASVASARIAQP